MILNVDKAEKYITREEAVSRLYGLMDSGILSDELVDDLQDIANCIEAEKTHNIFLWGADLDATELFTAYREDLWTDELKQKMDSIYEKYKIREIEPGEVE